MGIGQMKTVEEILFKIDDMLDALMSARLSDDKDIQSFKFCHSTIMDLRKFILSNNCEHLGKPFGAVSSKCIKCGEIF